MNILIVRNEGNSKNYYLDGCLLERLLIKDNHPMEHFIPVVRRIREYFGKDIGYKPARKIWDDKVIMNKSSCECNDCNDFLRVASEMGYTSNSKDAMRQVSQAVLMDLSNFKRALEKLPEAFSNEEYITHHNLIPADEVWKWLQKYTQNILKDPN